MMFSSCIEDATARDVIWTEFHRVEQTEQGYRTAGEDPWIVSALLSPSAEPGRHYFALEIQASTTTRMQLFWSGPGQKAADGRSTHFEVPATAHLTTRVLDLGAAGTFTGAEIFRLDPSAGAGLEFQIGQTRLLSIEEVPQEHLEELIQFRCFTSKLHYRPGELIEYGATLRARNWPEHRSAKLLEVSLVNYSGMRLAGGLQQVRLDPENPLKELRGVLETTGTLPAGRYRLEATLTDLMTGLRVSSAHDFGIQGENDVAVFETPFRFVKDFSLVFGPDDRWHIFSISGDFLGTHEWREAGQERTFSHGSSPDLKHWTHHEPVLSITDKDYRDGNGRYGDRNIWAPHIIAHEGVYYMFFTTVNSHVSQSVSLATSADLFHWTEHDANPVFTLETAEWALWRRDGWSDCRDPMVVKGDDGFYLYVTATAKEADVDGTRGVVAVAKSQDLVSWTTGTIALRAPLPPESPQVWKQGELYYILTSSNGAGSFVSEHPAHGWRRTDFPRPDIAAVEAYVKTSASYAEEVATGATGAVIGCLTWRLYGNSIYFFRLLAEPHGKMRYDPVRW